MSQTSLQNPNNAAPPPEEDLEDTVEGGGPEGEGDIVNDDDAPQYSPDEEARARERGWRPPSELRGKVRGEPIADPAEYNRLHDLNNHKVRAERDKYEADLTELKSLTQKNFEMLRSSKDAEIDRLKKDAEKRQRAAVLEADTDAYDEATRDLRALETAKPAPADPNQAQPGQQPPPRNQAPDPNYRAWHENNPWYKTDPVRTDYAEYIAWKLQETGVTPQSAGMSYYERVSAAVEKTFGAFGSPQPPGARQTSAGAPPRQKQSFDSLPGDVKKEFKDVLVKKFGIYKDDDKGRAEYAKAYFEEQTPNPYARN